MQTGRSRCSGPFADRTSLLLPQPTAYFAGSRLRTAPGTEAAMARGTAAALGTEAAMAPGTAAAHGTEAATAPGTAGAARHQKPGVPHRR